MIPYERRLQIAELLEKNEVEVIIFEGKDFRVL